MFSGNENIANEKQVEWYRSNHNLLKNSCSFVFEITFRVKNHPVYKSISLELYRISRGANLKILFGFKENSTREANMLNLLIKDLKEYKWTSELVKHGKSVIGRAPLSLEITILNPYRNEFLLKIFELLNQTYPSQLPVEDFKIGVNDMLFEVIPNIKQKNKKIGRNMERGLIKPDTCRDSITYYHSNHL